MGKPERISYAIMALLLALVGLLHLATLAFTTLFGYFALRQFSFGRSKALGVTIYIIAVAAIGYGLFYFSRQAYKTLPDIADTTIPAVVNFAEKQGIELPFTDYASLRTVALSEIKDRIANVGRYARAAFLQLAMLIIGLVVAVSLFISAKWDADNDPDVVKDSLYSAVVRELGVRFQTFYRSFARVIGAQILISTINTGLTAVFLAWNGYPYIMVIIVLTFLFGLVPIIGNIISNTLIVIHKLEYFLNSKIIGDRIKNPMWLILVGLVLGEKLMGVPGMILAPVVLHYIKVEASRNKWSEGVRAEPA